MIPLIRFIEPGAALVKEKDLVRKVELAYRICYKSEDKVSETSKSLVQRLTNSRKPDRHTSPLEHARIVVHIHALYFHEIWEEILKASNHMFFDVNIDEQAIIGNFRAFHDFLIEVTKEDECGNWMCEYSVLREFGNELHNKFPEVFPMITPCPYGDEKSDWLTKDNPPSNTVIAGIEEDEHYKTFHIITSRDILQELARHRTMSFSVESTRYCNYGNKGYQFVIPRPYGWAEEFDWEDENKIDSIIQRTLIDKQSHTVSEKRRMYDGSIQDVGIGVAYTEVNSVDAINNVYDMKDTLIDDCYLAAARYEKMLSMNVKPQCARMLLPGALKTELFMTGTDEAWNHFLVLRNSQAAHPMMRYLAENIEADLKFNKHAEEARQLEEETQLLINKQ